MSSGRHEVVNEYRIPSNYPEHAAIVQIHGPPGIKRGAQVKPAVRPNSLAAEVADDIRHAFVQYDSDHSGYIELRELERVTAALTLAHSPRPLTQTLTQMRTTLRRSGAHAHAHARTTMPHAVHTNAHTPSTRHRPPLTRHALRGLGLDTRLESDVLKKYDANRSGPHGQKTPRSSSRAPHAVAAGSGWHGTPRAKRSSAHYGRPPSQPPDLPTSPPRYCRASRLQSGLSPPAGAAGWTSSSSTSSCWTCALRETTPWGAPSKPYGRPRQTSPWVATVATAMAAATVGRRRLASHTGAQPTNRCWAAAGQQASPQTFPWGAGGAGGVCRRGQESPRQTNP